MIRGDPAEGTRLIRALRLRNHGLVPGRRRWAGPADVARGMLAMQGQDFAGVKLALSMRSGPTGERPNQDAVERCFADGSIVRNRPSRGTLQVTAPEDLRWMTHRLAPRSMAAATRRRQDLGLNDEALEAAERVLRSELADGAALTRKALQQRLGAAGLPDGGPQTSHLLGHHTQSMTIVHAAPDGKAETYALADTWISESRSLDRDEALGELATRYFDGRGPATVNDFAWWSNLTMGDARSAIDLAGSALEAAEIGGTGYLVAAGMGHLSAQEVTDALGVPLLLAPFDEYLLGYTVGRDAVLEPALAPRINPGANGMFKAVVVVEGEVVGTWRRTIRAKAVEIEISPFARLPTTVQSDLRERADEIGAHLAKPATVEIS